MPEISTEPQQNIEAHAPKISFVENGNPEISPIVSKSKLRKLKNTLSWDAFTKKEDDLATLLRDKETLKIAITSQNPEQMFDALTIFNRAANYLGSSDSRGEPPENKDDFVKLIQEVVDYNRENGFFDNYLNYMDRKIEQRSLLSRIVHKNPSEDEHKKEIDDKLEVRRDVLNLVIFAISNNKPGSSEKAVDFLAKNFVSTLKLAQEGISAGCKDKRADILTLLMPLSSRITASDIKPLVDNLITLFEDKQFQETATFSIKQIEANDEFQAKPIRILNNEDAPDELATTIIDRILNKYGLDQKDRKNILSNWLRNAPMPLEGKGVDSGKGSVAENFSQLAKLENERPGITKRLYEKFGITYFARYPIDLLIEQDRKFQEGFSGKYGIIVNPMHDNSGSFYADKTIWEKLDNQTRDANYSVCVWEANSINDLAHIVNTSRKKFGLISFAIVGGHGASRKHSKENAFINFGEGKLAQSDLQRKGAEAFRAAFIDYPKIILNSCITGERNGIAQLMSDVAGTEVTGPNDTAVLRQLDFSIDDAGNPNFNVEYNVPHTTYDKGRVVEQA